MTAYRDVDLFLRAHFETTADPSVLDGQIDTVLTATAGRRQQPAWLAALRSHPMSTTARSLGRPLSSPAWALLIILALLVAITAVGLTTGAIRLPAAPIVNGPSCSDASSPPRMTRPYSRSARTDQGSSSSSLPPSSARSCRPTAAGSRSPSVS